MPFKFMICALIAVVGSSFFVSRQAHAYTDHQFGLGVVIGTTSGFTGKFIQDRKTAYDGTIGWGDSDNYRLSGDRLWQKSRLFLVNEEPIDGYFGFGGRMIDRGDGHKNSSDNGIELGPRAVGGLNYMFHDPRIEVFAELGLVMDIIPATDADIEIGLGGRYYF